jgi:hypothetical protein
VLAPPGNSPGQAKELRPRPLELRDFGLFPGVASNAPPIQRESRTKHMGERLGF